MRVALESNQLPDSKVFLLLCVSGKAKAEVGGDAAATTSSASSSSSVSMQDFELLKVLGTGGECSTIGSC